MLEICFSESAGGCLKSAMDQGILEKAPLACLMMALSFGDISNPEDIESKKEFYDTLLEGSRLKYSGILKKYMKEFQRQRESADAVRIWYSEAPGEFCGMLYAASVFEGKGIPVYRVNCSGMLMEAEAGIVKGIAHGGELEPTETAILANSAELMSEAELKKCAAAWERLSKENALLRAVIDGEVRSVDVTYYDDALLRLVPEGKEVMVARIIGDLMGEYYFLEDYFIAKLIRKLIDDGKLREVKIAKQFYRSVVARA
ncbi:MAG: DUF1835 domain-containing protein [Clostridia bacterium]|nr:DUF1835 domain-containing protein [Clostridia bacterium]